MIAQLRLAAHPLLKTVLHWAEFHRLLKAQPPAADGQPGPAVLEAVKNLSAAAQTVDVKLTQGAIFAISALLMVGEYGDAMMLAKYWLRGLPQPEGSLSVRHMTELRGLMVEACLRINRLDLAQQEVAAMEKLDEEAVATQVAAGVLALQRAQNKSSVEMFEQVLVRFRDLVSRYGQSAKLLNLIALAQMGLRRFEDAEKTLLEALGISSVDEDTIANMAVLSEQMGKPSDAANRYLLQLTSSSHWGWTRSLKGATCRLDDAIQAFAAGDDAADE